MKTANEIVQEIERPNKTEDEWLQIKEEIIIFLKSNPLEEEKKLFVPLGYAEMVCIICDGIERKRGMKK